MVPKPCRFWWSYLWDNELVARVGDQGLAAIKTPGLQPYVSCCCQQSQPDSPRRGPYWQTSLTGVSHWYTL